MKWDEIFEALTKDLKLPETIEEAMEYISRDPICQNTIEDLAFKQVVLNILVAAGIVTEQDFNNSVNHFKGLITKNFAENLLQKIGQPDVKVFVESEPQLNPPNSEDPSLDSDDWPDDKIGKA